MKSSYRVIHLSMPAVTVGSPEYASALERALAEAAHSLEPAIYRLVGIAGYQCAVFVVYP